MLKRALIASCMILGFSISSANAMLGAGIGPYVDINGGYGFSDSNTINSAVNQKNSGFGYNINAGWMFIPFIGLEAGYTKYTDVTYRLNNQNQSASSDSYDIAIKGVAPLPLTGFSLYGKLGVGQLRQGSLNFSSNNIDKQTANNLYWAVGAKYDIALGFYSQLQYAVQQGGNSLPSNSLLSLGIGYQL